jgi:hypothetical protein
MASQYACLADIPCLGLAQLHQALLLVALPPRAPPLQEGEVPQPQVPRAALVCRIPVMLRTLQSLYFNFSAYRYILCTQEDYWLAS